MKKFPFTTIPIVLWVIMTLLFIFFVPEGQDLIPGKDYQLGQIIGYIFIVTLILDAVAFYRKRNRNRLKKD